MTEIHTINPIPISEPVASPTFSTTPSIASMNDDDNNNTEHENIISSEKDTEDDVDNSKECMSPKRSIEDVEKLGSVARDSLIAQAKQLQASLLAIVDKVEIIKEEHDKLEGGNKFLQQYIGELIQTTKMNSAALNRVKSNKR